MKSEKNFAHIPVINSLRGLAALSVCLYHFVCTTTNYILDENILDIFHFGKKGVQVFFIISGIVIPLSMLKVNYNFKLLPKFILKRFTRIEPPYIGVVLLGIVYLVARNFVPSATQIDLTPSFRDVALHLGYLIPFVEDAKWINPVFWTLSVEFQYYLFLAILFPLVLSGVKYLRFVFYFLVMLIPVFFGYGQAFFTHWSAYFALGIFYVLFITKRVSLLEFIITIALASIVVYTMQGLVDLCIGLSTLAIIHFFRAFTNKVGEFLGKVSYSVYLLHSIVGAGFINYMSHIYRAPYQKVLVILGGVVITILASYIYWKLIERPSQKLGNNIKLLDSTKK